MLALKPYRPEETEAFHVSLEGDSVHLHFCDNTEGPPENEPAWIQAHWMGTYFSRIFRAEELRSVVAPMRDYVQRIDKPFLVTICQGFSNTRFLPRKFLAIRFVLRLGNQSDFNAAQIRQWKESLIFTRNTQWIPSRWLAASLGGGILLHVNVPLYADSQGHLVKAGRQLPIVTRKSVTDSVLKDISLWQKTQEHLTG